MGHDPVELQVTRACSSGDAVRAPPEREAAGSDSCQAQSRAFSGELARPLLTAGR